MTNSIIRWSLRSLANQKFDKETAHILVGDVTSRLSRQLVACEALMTSVKETRQTITSPQEQLQHNQLLRNLDNLTYMHRDTYKLCHQINDSNQMFDRWSTGDHHVVKAAVTQVEARHASSLERWVDVATATEIDTEQLSHHLQSSVESILEGRNGIQLLCDHFLMLHKGRPNGRISIDCNLQECVEEATLEAKNTCEVHLQESPEVIFTSSRQNEPICATIIKPWVHHSLVELLKNAMHATVKEARKDGTANTALPPILIVIESMQDFVTLSVMDQGFGLPFVDDDDDHKVEFFVFGLGQSSAGKRWDRLHEQQSYAAVRSPMCSLGMGLPTSRMLMRQFGGDVHLTQRRDNQTGCVAHISLPKDDTILEREPGRTTTTKTTQDDSAYLDQSDLQYSRG